LREADRRKNEFIAMLSHELRNPLAPLRNCLHILDRVKPGSPQARKSLEIIHRQVDQLIRLVGDLLDVTRITRGKIQLRRQTVELSNLLFRTCEDHSSEFAKAEIHLETNLLQGRTLINADPDRVAQLVGNLLQNAAKFTPKGGRVSLTLAREQDSNQAVIRVRDTGAGIAPGTLAHLFEPFRQGDETLDRSKGGLGLGLSLVKGLTELHGGNVEAKSQGLGQGAEFIVHLPLEPEQVANDIPNTFPRQSRARRILIIEDNVDAANSLREALELSDHRVEVANDGRSGIAKALTFRPDVVLCDIGLPELDGYSVVRCIRAEPMLQSVFAVALTGYTMPEDLTRAREAGFDEHLAKPATLEMLHQVLAKTSCSQSVADSSTLTTAPDAETSLQSPRDRHSTRT
jgi:two-component system CheB/CheR fusion protein